MLRIKAKVTIDVGLAVFGEQLHMYLVSWFGKCAAWVVYLHAN